MKNKIYTMKLDSDFDKSFKILEKQFHPNEKIVSTESSGDLLIITTEIDDKRPRNLLLEEIGRGKIPAEILGLSTEKDDD